MLLACAILALILVIASQAPPYALSVAEFKATTARESVRYRIDATVAENTQDAPDTGRLCDPSACIDVVLDTKERERFQIGADVIVTATWEGGKLHVTEVLSRCQSKSPSQAPSSP